MRSVTVLFVVLFIACASVGKPPSVQLRDQLRANPNTPHVEITSSKGISFDCVAYPGLVGEYDCVAKETPGEAMYCVQRGHDLIVVYRTPRGEALECKSDALKDNCGETDGKIDMELCVDYTSCRPVPVPKS